MRQSPAGVAAATFMSAGFTVSSLPAEHTQTPSAVYNNSYGVSRRCPANSCAAAASNCPASIADFTQHCLSRPPMAILVAIAYGYHVQPVTAIAYSWNFRQRLLVPDPVSEPARYKAAISSAPFLARHVNQQHSLRCCRAFFATFNRRMTEIALAATHVLTSAIWSIHIA